MLIKLIAFFTLIIVFIADLSFAMDSNPPQIEKLSDGLYTAEIKHPKTGHTLYFALEHISTDDVGRFRSLRTFSSVSSKLLIANKNTYPLLAYNREKIDVSSLNDGHDVRGFLLMHSNKEKIFVVYISNKKITHKLSLPAFADAQDFTDDMLKNSNANGIEMIMGVATTPDFNIQSHMGITRIFSIPSNGMAEEGYWHERISVSLHAFAALAISHIARENGFEPLGRKMITVPLENMGRLLKGVGIDESAIKSTLFCFDMDKSDPWLADACPNLSWLNLEWGKDLFGMRLSGAYEFVVVDIGPLQAHFGK